MQCVFCVFANEVCLLITTNDWKYGWRLDTFGILHELVFSEHPNVP